MKELSIEQKAARYDGAIERANKLQKTCDSTSVIGWCEYIFPELQEGRGERIKNLIYCLIRDRSDNGKLLEHNGVSVEEALAWLEKKDEPSIYAVPSRNIILAVWELGNEWKELTKCRISTEHGTQLEYIQKHWNESEYYLREKQGEQKPNYCHHEVDLSECSEEYRKAYYDGWNNCNQQHAQLEAEQKPAWSEDDEKMLTSIVFSLAGFMGNEDKIEWLKSIKERVKPKQEWSEEDERTYKSITYSFAHNYPLTVHQQEFVKSIKERCTWKPSDEQMEALLYEANGWSEDSANGQNLKSLYQDLKNLKG